jgi:Na+/proline symporter
MSWDSIYHSVEHFLPLVFTIIIMWAALILLRDRPGDVLRVIIEEFTKLSKLQIDLKSVNFIGAFLIFALIIGFLVESLLHTAFMMAASHSAPENELMANAFTCGLILFFGLYFLICISISKSTK